MTDTTPDSDTLVQCVNRFIELANTLKSEGVDIKTVSAALMSASGIYTTYIYAGNEGGLEDSGVEKVTALYKHELERIQQVKKDSGGQ